MGGPHAPVASTPRERPGTHYTGGWVGPRAGLDRSYVNVFNCERFLRHSPLRLTNKKALLILIMKDKLITVNFVSNFNSTLK